MTARDRIVLIVIVLVGILGASWMLLVSPERKQASKEASEVASAQSALSTAENELSSARSAEAKYSAAYTSIVSLGKAVPASEEVPSLIYQLDEASNSRDVNFASIVAGSGASGSGSAGAASGASATAAAASAGFTQMPFTFIFNGTFFDLEHLFKQLDGFTVHTTAGGLQVSGRLLTIQGLKLSPLVAGEGTNASKGPRVLSGSITATAYVLPASQGLTAGATPSAPAGATPASTSSSSSSTPAPATVTP
jgi:hypothetical protein